MSIATEITRLTKAKDDLKAEIIKKGVAVGDDVKIDEYAGKVAAIPTGEIIDTEYDSDNTKVLIDIKHEELLDFPMRLSSNGGCTINWGDGTSTEVTSSINTTHKYSNTGKYTIEIIGDVTLMGTWWSWLGVGLNNTSIYGKCVIGAYVGRKCNQIVFWNMNLSFVVYAKGINYNFSFAGYSDYYRANISNIYNCPNSYDSNNGAPDLVCAKNIEIGTTTQRIGINAFYNCKSIESIVVPDSVTSIKSSAFYNNKLSTVEIGIGIEDIDTYAFQGNRTCVKLTIKSSEPPTIASNSFQGLFSASAKIIVPKGCLSAYQTADNWAQYADLMVEAE